MDKRASGNAGDMPGGSVGGAWIGVAAVIGGSVETAVGGVKQFIAGFTAQVVPGGGQLRRTVADADAAGGIERGSTFLRRRHEYLWPCIGKLVAENPEDDEQ